MLPLRYRFGLLLNPVDDVAVCLRDAQAPAVLGPRSRYTFDCSLLPLTQLAAGSAFTAFAIGAGKGFLLVVPADFDDDAIRSLAERAADRLGAMASTPTSPVCQKDSKPERRFPLSDLKIILSKACLCIMSKSDTAWSVSIPWGDSRLKEAGGASINRKTDQIRLLAALASAPSSEGRTVLALQRAQGVGSLRSESRFRVRVPRLRRGLARVLGPYVADESGTEGVSLEYRILPELPQGETGGSYELGILVTVEPDANVC
jgi:hypothetical protein